jgi:hypothetical protein
VPPRHSGPTSSSYWVSCCVRRWTDWNGTVESSIARLTNSSALAVSYSTAFAAVPIVRSTETSVACIRRPRRAATRQDNPLQRQTFSLQYRSVCHDWASPSGPSQSRRCTTSGSASASKYRRTDCKLRVVRSVMRRGTLAVSRPPHLTRWPATGSTALNRRNFAHERYRQTLSPKGPPAVSRRYTQVAVPSPDSSRLSSAASRP